MRMNDIISKTKNKVALNQDEIKFFIKGLLDYSIPDYQVTAWLMAAYIQGLTEDELLNLTLEMANSGKTISFKEDQRPIIDKHSTGGVGDKITIIATPILAALGCSIAKLSGRSLSYAGGTLDKLESIPNFRVEMDTKQFEEQFSKIGIVVAGQSEDITPADKRLYQLRDVTETVNSLPLIASSIMSKKLAVDSDVIILDVKIGEGSFCKTLEEAIQLAKIMVKIGEDAGRKTEAIISSMEQPLGYNIGNSLEVKEAIRALKGQVSDDIKELVDFIVTRALILSNKANSNENAKLMIDEVISSGNALEKLVALIEHQGGDSSLIKNEDLFKLASYRIVVASPVSGIVQSIKASVLGFLSMGLGAGRVTVEDKIDYTVGIELRKKVGETVLEGEVLAVIHSNQLELAESTAQKVLEQFKIGDDFISKPSILRAHVFFKNNKLNVFNFNAEEA